MTATYKARSYVAYTAEGDLVNNYVLSHPVINFISHEAMTGDTSGGNWRKALGKADVGNPWVKDGYIIRATLPEVRCIHNSQYSYVGRVSCMNGVDASTSLGRGQFGTLPASSLSNLTAAGATAISRCAPTVPAADTLVGLAEIYREGIPKMVGSSLKKDVRRFQSLGDEYLNYQFGWMPLVNDLRKLSKAIFESDEIITQLTRNSGKVVRRGYTFPSERSSAAQYVDQQFTPVPIMYYKLRPGPSTNRFVNSSTEVNTWFSGAFTYHADLKGLNAWDRVGDFATRARHLYGIKLTPDVVWNLMPWSWLVDWETNFGDVLTNVGLFSNDGLVMLYGYMMQEKSIITKRHQVFSFNYANPSTYMSVTLERHNKVRRRASPWGFGLTIDDLSTRQIAILAALGISRI